MVSIITIICPSSRNKIKNMKTVIYVCLISRLFTCYFLDPEKCSTKFRT